MNTEKILNYLRRRTAGDEEVAAADVIERQAAQIEVMREAKIDAERYRWLRNALTDRSGNGVSHHFCSISRGHPEELDDSIDAAIAATPKGEVK